MFRVSAREGTFRFYQSFCHPQAGEPSVPFSGNGMRTLLHKRKKVRRRFRHKLCGRIHDIEFPQRKPTVQRNDQQLSKLCIVLNRCAGKGWNAHPQCDAADQRSGIIHHSAMTFKSSSESPRFSIIERFLFCPRSILRRRNGSFSSMETGSFNFQTGLKMRCSRGRDHKFIRSDRQKAAGCIRNFRADQPGYRRFHLLLSE